LAVLDNLHVFDIALLRTFWPLALVLWGPSRLAWPRHPGSLKAVATMPVMVTGGFRTLAGMEAALQAGHTDVIGLARPFCLDPDFPLRMMAATLAALTVLEDRLVLGRGYWGPNSASNTMRALNNQCQVGGYYDQIERLAAGLSPDPGLSPSHALLAHLGKDFRRALARKLAVARPACAAHRKDDEGGAAPNRLLAGRFIVDTRPMHGDFVTLLGGSPGATLLLATIVLASLIGLFAMPSIIQPNLFRPYWLVRRREYWTLITSAFIHADLAHLFFNAFTFWAFAFQLERTIGSARFLTLYVFGLFASDAGTYFKHRGDPAYQTLGASGAILAVLFAYIVYFPTASIFILPIPFPIPAPLFAVAYLTFTYYASRQARGRINHDAHLTGALAGLAFVALTDSQAIARALRTLVD
jgi:membrane associated rhomboid family serine protease